MKSRFLIMLGAFLLVLFLIAYKSDVDLVGGFKTGLLIGAGLVVFVLYPAYLRNHERRLETLERSLGPSRDMPAIERKL